jgi:hypothetical protein
MRGNCGLVMAIIITIKSANNSENDDISNHQKAVQSLCLWVRIQFKAWINYTPTFFCVVFCSQTQWDIAMCRSPVQGVLYKCVKNGLWYDNSESENSRVLTRNDWWKWIKNTTNDVHYNFWYINKGMSIVNLVRFRVTTVVNTKEIVFWDVLPRTLVKV